MIILMRLLGRLFEMAYEFQACAARIRTLPWKIFLGYVRSGTPVPPSHLPARGSAFLSRISAIPQTITQN